MLVPPAGGIETSKQHHHQGGGAPDEDEHGAEHAKHADAEARHASDDKHFDNTAGADLKSSNVYAYCWTVPPDHATGLFWYHPHPHGISEQQVLSGMSGLMIIEKDARTRRGGGQSALCQSAHRRQVSHCHILEHEEGHKGQSARASPLGQRPLPVQNFLREFNWVVTHRGSPPTASCPNPRNACEVVETRRTIATLGEVFGA